jgi:hypothetical protein
VVAPRLGFVADPFMDIRPYLSILSHFAVQGHCPVQIAQGRTIFACSDMV